MTSNIEKLYRFLRILIYLMPAVVISYGVFLILFPIEDFQYSSIQPDLSKFEITKDEKKNESTFGVFPTLNYQYIDLNVSLKELQNNSCFLEPTQIVLEKTYRAFLYPEAEPIRSPEELKEYIFRNNKSQYPNGSLLHLKPTDEVYLISDGKKILFPGPEIFRAFGYSFDNLVDVGKPALDQFPNADNRVFLWTHPHPDGTIFQAYPSHKIFLVADGKKREIENPKILGDAWPKYFTILVSDPDAKNQLACSVSSKEMKDGKIACLFDRRQLSSSLGGYYNFTMIFPQECLINNIGFDNAQIQLIPEKSFATVKDSLRRIFASIINRYYLKQPT